ncbi:hypothetical protein, partial [Actinomadura sp. 6K520]|uniref:hypothetical protein n=1 Tax=Actinomadura sp. 6K520 TaxID=2530364 RepID=UPI001A9F8952
KARKPTGGPKPSTNSPPPTQTASSKDNQTHHKIIFTHFELQAHAVVVPSSALRDALRVLPRVRQVLSMVVYEVRDDIVTPY